MAPADSTVMALSFTLIILIVLLVFFYKKLNREANDKYTIRNMVYKEGGVRDRVRGAVLAVETNLGVQLWPRGEDEEEEMDECAEGQHSDGDVEAGTSQPESDGSETDGEDEQEDSVDHSGSTQEKEGDNSSVEGLETGEEDRLMNNKLEVRVEVEDKNDEKQEKEVKEESKAEASGGTGLLIDLKQFSGSAIWSEEGGEGQSGDMTAL